MAVWNTQMYIIMTFLHIKLTDQTCIAALGSLYIMGYPSIGNN